jgi:hypothetical protein
MLLAPNSMVIQTVGHNLPRGLPNPQESFRIWLCLSTVLANHPLLLLRALQSSLFHDCSPFGPIQRLSFPFSCFRSTASFSISEVPYRMGLSTLNRTPQPEGPGYIILSGSSPLIRPAWETLPIVTLPLA